MKQKKSPPRWFRRRRYLHFDHPVSLRFAKTLVTNPTEVSRHAFYPFLQVTLTSMKKWRDKNTGHVHQKEKLREIAFASHVDSHIYAYYGWVLSELYEKKLESLKLGNSVLAFRSLGKGNIDFAKIAFDEVKRRVACDVVCFDIKGFFDSLDHCILKRQWANLLEVGTLPQDHFKVFRSITKWQYVNRTLALKALGLPLHNPGLKCKNERRLCRPDQFRSIIRSNKLIVNNLTGKGIPQGSPISAILSNLYLLDLDQQLKQFADSSSGLYLRYCDDILLIVPQGVASCAETAVETAIKAVRLEVQSDKTELVCFRAGQIDPSSTGDLQYLGFKFNGNEIRIRPGSIGGFFEKMRKGVTKTFLSRNRLNKPRIASGKGPRKAHLKKLYRKYSYLGRRNFLTYGYRAASSLGDEIYGQLKPAWRKLRRLIRREG
jgi:RNA-directed DNA polymerase